MCYSIFKAVALQFLLLCIIYTQFNRIPQFDLSNNNGISTGLPASRLFQRRGGSLPVTNVSFNVSNRRVNMEVDNSGPVNNSSTNVNNSSTNEVNGQSELARLRLQNEALLRQQALLARADNSALEKLINSGSNGETTKVFNEDLFNQFGFNGLSNSSFNMKKFLDDIMISRHCNGILDKLRNRQVNLGAIKESEALTGAKLKPDFPGFPDFMFNCLLLENAIELLQSKPLDNFSKADLAKSHVETLLLLVEFTKKTLYHTATTKLNVLSLFGGKSYKKCNGNNMSDLKQSIADGSNGEQTLFHFRPKFVRNNANRYDKNKGGKPGQGATAKTFKVPNGLCIRFNKGKCEKENCDYKHYCAKCFANHSMQSCPKL